MIRSTFKDAAMEMVKEFARIYTREQLHLCYSRIAVLSVRHWSLFIHNQDVGLVCPIRCIFAHPAHDPYGLSCHNRGNRQ